MLPSSKRAWAIGFKHHVELRTSAEQPKRIRTVVRRKFLVPRFSPITGALVGHDPQMKELTQVYHEGGRVSATIKSDVLRRRYGVAVKYGEVREIPTSVFVQIRDDRRRERATA